MAVGIRGVRARTGVLAFTIDVLSCVTALKVLHSLVPCSCGASNALKILLSMCVSVRDDDEEDMKDLLYPVR